MKKMNEIKDLAEFADEPFDQTDDIDLLVKKLSSEGHRVLNIGRSLITIEFSEYSDDLPDSTAGEAMKLTVYADPHLTGNQVDEFYIFAGRYGVTDIVRCEPGHAKAGSYDSYEAICTKAGASLDPIEVIRAFNLTQRALIAANGASIRYKDGSIDKYSNHPEFQDILAEYQKLSEKAVNFLNRLPSTSRREQKP